jgi:hypothetical protein
MSWLERLKALTSEEHATEDCQNRQNPGSVSFVSASGGLTTPKPGAAVDPFAAFAVALHSGALQQCKACRHFTASLPADADDLGVLDAGWCGQYQTATDPLLPFWCDGYCPAVALARGTPA